MFIPYREQNHGSFDEEWNPHSQVNDWWYVTGYLQRTDRPDSLYSYQFTVINPRRFGKNIWSLDTAFSDMRTGEHFFKRKLRLPGKQTGVLNEAVHFLPYGLLEKNPNEMVLTTRTKELELNLNLNPGKGAFWHGDNGILVMGLKDDSRQRTVYYSYTNMPTTGSVRFVDNAGNKQEFSVTGKSWFDRQWGPFRLGDSDSYWEWFSIRFFDDEEVMLFAFPQTSYYDGTFIGKDGKTRRIENYKYTCHTLKKKGKILFSWGWDIVLPGVKEENYRISPMNDGQYNNGYCEVMAMVTNMDGTEVGYCFAELLPGIRQQGKKFGLINLALDR